MVTVTGPPTTAEVEARSVSTVAALEVGLGVKLAVTPVGRLEALKATLPVKPLAGVMAMESVLLPPWPTVSVPDVGASAKLGAALTVSATVVVSVSAPETPVMVTVTGPPVVAVLVAVSVSVASSKLDWQ